MTPGIPERPLTVTVKVFTGRVIAVKPERICKAKREPIPEKAVIKRDLKKCLLLKEAVSIIIRERAKAEIKRMFTKFKKTTTFKQ